MASTTHISDRAYWQSVSARWSERRPQRLWRAHSDAININLCRRWWPKTPVRRVLKTDAFDEAFGDGLVPFLAERAAAVASIDCSFDTAVLARRATEAATVAADVRRLPFESDSFDLVVSNSTLDHFQTRDEIAAALVEIHRVLAPGGSLVLTLDNPSNPVVALRNRLPFALVHRTGLVPYYVGVTCDRADGERLLVGASFDVVDRTTVMHCPRAMAVAGAAAIDAIDAAPMRRAFLRAAAAFERLEETPSAGRTGYFSAFLATKRP